MADVPTSPHSPPPPPPWTQNDTCFHLAQSSWMWPMWEPETRGGALGCRCRRCALSCAPARTRPLLHSLTLVLNKRDRHALNREPNSCVGRELRAAVQPGDMGARFTQSGRARVPPDCTALVI